MVRCVYYFPMRTETGDEVSSRSHKIGEEVGFEPTISLSLESPLNLHTILLLVLRN